MNNVLRNWFLASRPWSFTMTAISVSVGSTLAAIDGDFSWLLYLITLLSIIVLHAASNLINDYYDVVNGVDHLDVSTAKYRPHPLLEGKLEPKQVRNLSYFLFGLVLTAGLCLTVTRGWLIVVFGLLGLFGGWLYTAPPLKYKYHALGEFAVFALWGPLMVEGAYYVQRQAVSLEAFWVSLPFGILVALVLLANNIRDMSSDKQQNIRTLPMLLGYHNGLRLYTSMIVLAYLAVCWMSYKGPLTFWSLLVLMSIPLAYRLLRRMSRDVPLDADARTAQLNTAFGALLVASLILEHLI